MWDLRNFDIPLEDTNGSPVMGLGWAQGVSGEAPFLHRGRAGRTHSVGLNAEPSAVSPVF